LDVKVRLPRDLHALESLFKGLVQSRFNRGALELKLERTTSDSTSTDRPDGSLEVNEERAREVLLAYQRLARALGSSESPTLRDIANFPDVIRTRGADEVDLQQTWKAILEPATHQALTHLMQMRETEGANLVRILRKAVSELRESITEVGQMRRSSESELKRRITEKLETIFQAYPIPPVAAGDSSTAVRSTLESRIAQELALAIDRTDIQEELHRFEGHLAHFEKTLSEAGAVGRKLEFILQELGREINTLGNKAQEFSISEQVVSIKVRLEQLREQVLNLE
ncbi:DUF1732 domain-containing protein, partial [bacterium]|nr:DUF1732 domain-containing protein [bacterium]